MVLFLCSYTTLLSFFLRFTQLLRAKKKERRGTRAGRLRLLARKNNERVVDQPTTMTSWFSFPSVYPLKVSPLPPNPLLLSSHTFPARLTTNKPQKQVRSDASLKATLRIDLATDPWELYLSGPSSLDKNCFPFTVGQSIPSILITSLFLPPSD